MWREKEFWPKHSQPYPPPLLIVPPLLAAAAKATSKSTSEVGKELKQKNFTLDPLMHSNHYLMCNCMQCTYCTVQPGGRKLIQASYCARFNVSCILKSVNAYWNDAKETSRTKSLQMR